MSQWIANLLLQVSLYMLWAIPFGVIYSTFRVFHLAHGAVYLVGGYAAAFAMIGIGQTSAPGHAGVTALAVGCLAGGLAAALTGVAINRTVYAPLQRRYASTLGFMVSAFGILMVIQNGLAAIFGDGIVSVRSRLPVQRVVVWGASMTTMELVLMGAALVELAAVALLLRGTRLGTAMRVVSGSRITASVVGFSPDAVVNKAFLIGSALAGFGACFSTANIDLQPSMALDVVLKAVVACVVGGTEHVWGAALGSVVIGVLESVAILVFPGGWKDGVTFALFICFLLLRPEGILGRVAERAG